MRRFPALSIKKILIGVLCLVFIASAALNIHQYSELKNIRLNNSQAAEGFMNAHEGLFSSVFEAIDARSDIPFEEYIKENIKNPGNLSITIARIMAHIQEAEFYYQMASQCVDFDRYIGKGERFSVTPNLIYYSGYVQELFGYQDKLLTGNITPEDTNKIIAVLNDIRVISNWLNEKYKKHDFTVYTDYDFYNEVYSKLTSDINKKIFQPYIDSWGGAQVK